MTVNWTKMLYYSTMIMFYTKCPVFAKAGHSLVWKKFNFSPSKPYFPWPLVWNRTRWGITKLSVTFNIIFHFDHYLWLAWGCCGVWCAGECFQSDWWWWWLAGQNIFLPQFKSMPTIPQIQCHQKRIHFLTHGVVAAFFSKWVIITSDKHCWWP